MLDILSYIRYFHLKFCPWSSRTVTWLILFNHYSCVSLWGLVSPILVTMYWCALWRGVIISFHYFWFLFDCYIVWLWSSTKHPSVIQIKWYINQDGEHRLGVELLWYMYLFQPGWGAGAGGYMYLFKPGWGAGGGGGGVNCKFCMQNKLDHQIKINVPFCKCHHFLIAFVLTNKYWVLPGISILE